jgi:tetratricopeptide (TPR) repeat protein
MRYDVFLSYASRDRAAVAAVSAALESRGIKVFFDRTSLSAGGAWVEELAQAIANARAFAVFAGSGSLGRVQRREVQLAFHEHAKRTAEGAPCPFIPVLLAGADEEVFSGFLELFTRIDARGGDAAAGPAFDALRRALDPSDVGATSAPSEPTVCPFRGLRAFSEQDGPWFFGRDHYAEKLVDNVHASRLSAVVGPSGSGKSSVVFAGLVPRLRRQRPPQVTWENISFTPERRPFHRLGVELARLWMPDGSSADIAIEGAKVGDALLSGQPLADFLVEALRRLPEAERLLIVVDQFEELFSLADPAADVAAPFVALLIDASQDARLSIVLTLRADFYGRAVALNRDLADALAAHQIALGPMRPAELRLAIEGPAQRAGVALDDGLADVLLADAAGQPGQLPLLEFALTELWSCRAPGEALSLAAYRHDVGGLAGAISQRAEQVFSSLAPREAHAAETVLPRLARVAAGSDEGSDTRSRLPLAGLSTDDLAVVNAFVDARLLVVSSNPLSSDSGEVAEVAHEALLRDWPRLKQWIDGDRRFLLWRQRITPLAAEWKAAHREREMLLRGRPLEEAKRWWRQRALALHTIESDFVRASIRAHTGSRALRWTAMGLAAAMSVGAWGWLEWQKSDPAQLVWLGQNAPFERAQQSSRGWADRHLETFQLFGTAAARADGPMLLRRFVDKKNRWIDAEVACMVLQAVDERRRMGDAKERDWLGLSSPERFVKALVDSRSAGTGCLIGLKLDTETLQDLQGAAARHRDQDRQENAEPRSREDLADETLNKLILSHVLNEPLSAEFWEQLDLQLADLEVGSWTVLRSIGILVRLQHTDRAIALVERRLQNNQNHSNRRYESDTLIDELVVALARQGDVASALAWLTKFKKSETSYYESVDGRNELAASYVRQGNFDAAEKLFVVDIADKGGAISGERSSTKATGLGMLVMALAERGEVARAKALMPEARKLAEENQDDDRSSRAFAALAGAEASLGDYKAARRYAERTKRAHSALRAHALALIGAYGHISRRDTPTSPPKDKQ